MSLAPQYWQSACQTRYTGKSAYITPAVNLRQTCTVSLQSLAGVQTGGSQTLTPILAKDFRPDAACAIGTVGKLPAARSV